MDTNEHTTSPSTGKLAGSSSVDNVLFDGDLEHALLDARRLARVGELAALGAVLDGGNEEGAIGAVFRAINEHLKTVEASLETGRDQVRHLRGLSEGQTL